MKLISKLRSSGIVINLIDFLNKRLDKYDAQLRIADENQFKRIQGRSQEMLELIEVFSHPTIKE